MLITIDLLSFLVQSIFPNLCLLLLFLSVSKWQKPSFKFVLNLVVGLMLLSCIDSFFSSGYKILNNGDFQFIFGSFPPVLPSLNEPSSKEYETIKSALLQEQENNESLTKSNRWALVTGASSGIGRSIAVQLARRKINLIMVGRNVEALSFWESELTSCYGISVHTISADFAIPDEGRRLFDHVEQKLTDVPVITYLILNAGLGPTALHTDLGKDHLVERVVRVNVESTATLASLFGNTMKAHSENELTNNMYHPRIMIVSSITGIAPGIPGASLYAATKAFGYHLAQGLSVEMETMGISVTSLCPGATATNFATQSKMENAILWKLPIFVHSADDVADQGVKAMFLGVSSYIPGFFNRLSIQLITPFAPSRIMMKLFRFLWQPWPFTFSKTTYNINSKDRKSVV